MSSWPEVAWAVKQIKDAVHFTENYEQLQNELSEYNSDLDLIDENLEELRQIIGEHQEQDAASLTELIQQVQDFIHTDFWTSVVPEDSFGSEAEGGNPFVIVDKDGETHNFYLKDVLAKNGGTVFLSDNANMAQGLTEKLAKKYDIELPE